MSYVVDRNHELKRDIDKLLSFYIRTLVSDKQRIPMKVLMENVEKTLLTKTLKLCNGNQKNTSRLLGLKSNTLCIKIKKMNIKIQQREHFTDLIDIDDNFSETKVS